MIPDPQETIVALSSSGGPGARAVIRLSGPDALRIAAALFDSPVQVTSRSRFAGNILLPGVARLPASLFVWLAPQSYTGQDIAEIHTVSAPPLLESLLPQLLNGGVRQAQPGEFTLRAFLAGKLDLTRAEAVLAVIEADQRDELKQALSQLAGGVTRPLELLRGDLLDLLADVEAGLDFADENMQFVDPTTLLTRVAKGLALVTLLSKQLEERGVSGRAFRAVLVGRPNAGKTSLFNALTQAAALVSPQPGTTRDYLVSRLVAAGPAVEIVDTAGLRTPAEIIERRAQSLGQNEADLADLLLLCVEASQPLLVPERILLERSGRPEVIGVATKCDLGQPLTGFLATSATAGIGLEELKEAILSKARAHPSSPLAPSLSRCRHHVQTCLNHLRRVHEHAREEDPPELLALELRGAMEALGAMVGAVYTDELLDRIFSRFCIGK